MTKIILGILAVLIVLLIIAGIIVATHLDALVKAGIETVGPKVTKTTLTVETVSLSPLSGAASVTGVALGNPEGYQAPQSVVISNAAVKLAPGSLFSSKIIIHSIELRGPEITFEGNPFGANNLSQIMANVNSTTATVDQAGTNAPAPADKKAAKKFEVDDLLITGAKVHAHLTGVIQRDITLPLPDIHLTDLGKGTDGITAADLIQKVLSEITTQTVNTLVGYAKSLGKDVTNAAKNAFHGAQGMLQDTNNAINQGLDRLKKGLFGK